MSQRNVLVQNSDTKFFVAQDRGWTPHAGEARDFHNSLSAVTFCLQNEMKRAQVVMRFNTPGTPDVVIQVSADGEAARNRTSGKPNEEIR
jgi:hypothetical protein